MSTLSTSKHDCKLSFDKYLAKNKDNNDNSIGIISKSTFDGFRKILSNENCYSIPQNLQAVPYNPNTLLEDGQWYSLSQFSEQNFCLSLLKENSFDSVNLQVFLLFVL